MKTLITVTLVLLACSAIALENPDGRTSITLYMGGSTSSGDYTLAPFTQKHDGKAVGGSVSFKIPTSTNLTLLFDVSYGEGYTQHDELYLVWHESKSTNSTLSFGAGLTIYFGGQ